MRHLYSTSLLILTLIATTAAADTATAPDWTLETPDGREVTLSEAVEERPVVLFFWATWCPFCKALMPHLESIDLELGDTVEILALNIRDDGDPRGYLAERGYSFTLLEDADSVAELYDVHGTPGVMIIDQNRAIRFDLHDLARPVIPEAVKARGRSGVAAYISAYWAAEIRRRLDDVL